MTVAAIYDPPRIPSRAVTVNRRGRGRAVLKQVTVDARGEVDASNAKQFSDAVCDAAVGAARVTVDLTDIGFMALDGIAALHAINARMMQAGASWLVLPGDATARVLRLCDPEGLIPTAPAGCGLRLVESA